MEALFSDRIYAIVNAVEDSGAELRAPDVAAATGLPTKQVYVYLRRCVDYGLLENPRRGTYSPVRVSGS